MVISAVISQKVQLIQPVQQMKSNQALNAVYLVKQQGRDGVEME